MTDSTAAAPPRSAAPCSLPAGSPRELRSSWGVLLKERPAGRSLWLSFVEAHQLRSGAIEIADLPRDPTPGDAAQIERFFAGLAESAAAARRTIAAVVQRPGTTTPTASDRAWASVLYDAGEAVGLAISPVHLASDAGIVTLPRVAPHSLDPTAPHLLSGAAGA